MKYPYQRLPDYYLNDSVPYYHQVRSEIESPAERLQDAPRKCLKIGDLAPDFSLEGVLGGERIKINLSDQKGRWTVVFFYASDFTFV
jgi:hypothetical protein